MHIRSAKINATTFIALMLSAGGAAGQVVDPGVRGGAAGAGGPIKGLSTLDTQFWKAAQGVFEEVFTVSGGTPGTQVGLGPRFNGNGCALCHSQPAVGGTSAATNPQANFITSGVVSGQTNTLPPFITANGPIQEARFINLPNGGGPDGSVHDLFTIANLPGASGCNIQQPNFAAAIAAKNISFRIPTPLFGVGLVEALTEQTLITDSLNISGPQQSLGIVSGSFNRSGNDTTIARFGWKAQNKSLLLFSGEAMNVEIGVTNELFPEERTDTPDDQVSLSQSCNLNPIPEDTTEVVDGEQSVSPASDFSSQMVNFGAFMRFNAAPVPALPAGISQNTVTQGNNQFVNIGCGACHIPQHTTGQSIFGPVMSNVTISPFSDFALHNMGTGLADGISQGLADGQHFRTAPLWGIGQRVFFLHDGRTNSLVTAIQAHASAGSEANAVINNFNNLGQSDQQAIVDFLRSL